MLPRPGTKRHKDRAANAAATAITLSETEAHRLRELLAAHPVVGARYGEGALKLVNR